jgi:2-polyprenyl-3-methyl-5-hydroxy-6-metoxy-1,4-benzoquinol methylase
MESGSNVVKPEQERFKFGKNWARFLMLVNGERIAAAEKSLKNMLGVETLAGKKFLDIGSGSGLFSLAARNLGASVLSFDYDSDSVGCTGALKDRFWPGDAYWQVEQGDALNVEYLNRLGQFDVVYSWGVLHHTGDMWRAMDNITPLVKEGGYLFLALYNDQRWLSRYWKRVKRLYNRGVLGKMAVILTHAPYFLFRHAIKYLLVHSRNNKRGMDPWRDIIDWLGGYPFEVARPEDVLAFYRHRGFILERMTTVDARHGCNEFVLHRNTSES